LKDVRYRFGECAIAIPPLRERQEEIPLLVQRALRSCTVKTQVEGPTGFTKAAMDSLCQGEYQGNVRQLEGMVLSAYLMARSEGGLEIDLRHLPAKVARISQFKRRGDPEVNRFVVERTLRITGGNVKKAAQLLGVSRTTVNAVRRAHITRRIHDEFGLKS